LGAYFAWVALTLAGLNYGIAILLAMLSAFVLGLILNTTTIQPLQGKATSETNIFIATLFASIALENVVIYVFGGRYKPIPPLVEGSMTLGPISFNFQQIVIMAVAPVCLVLLMLFLNKTKSGMAVRAVAQDADGAAIVGIDSRRTYAYCMGLGSMMAGLAGVLLGVIVYLYPSMGSDLLVRALFVMVLGGMGSIKGTIYGAYIIGFVDSFVRTFIGMFWSSPALFLMFILILLIKPEGLFGVKAGRL
jgi:branched-chain amino acid transport system permease protein